MSEFEDDPPPNTDITDFEKNLIKLSKTKDPALKMKLLVNIRTEVDWPKCRTNIEKLSDKNNLRAIVACLTSKQKNLVDIALSILGNCCMSATCANSMKRHNILSLLHQLLNRYGNKEDCINGRIFRILGNLCKHRDDWPLIVVDRKPQIIAYIVELLKSLATQQSHVPSEGTIIMAIRCIREVVNSYTLIQLVKGLGVLKPLGVLLIDYSEEWNKSKTNENVLHQLIKAIHEYSKYHCQHSLFELKSTERGSALVYLSDILLIAPRIIVKTVMNFIQMSQLKSDLPIPQICDGFMRLLEDQSFIKEFHGQYSEYIQCLCYLFDHPANRNADRCGKSIPYLVDVLRHFRTVSEKTLTCSTLIIVTLNQCKYNDALITEQLKYNIIQILTDKLEWVVGTSSSLNLKHVQERKRKYESRATLDVDIGSPLSSLRLPLQLSSSDDEDMFSHTRYSRSPSPSSSSDSDLSIWDTSPSRMVWSQAVKDSDSDSDNYSPVCSEADTTEFTPGSSSDFAEMDTFSDLDERMREVTKIEMMSSLPSSNLKSRLTIEILRLLKTYIKVNPPHPQLASPNLLLALIKSSIYFGTMVSSRLDALDVVCRILHHHDYLLHLMQTDFIPTVYELTNIEHSSSCVKCTQFQFIGSTVLKRLCNLAESAIGKGNVAHQMLRGGEEIKRKLTLVIPYIVRSRTILSKLMINCGGLDTLMALFKESDELRVKSINILCILASKKLGICNPKKSTGGLHRAVVVTGRYQLDQTCSEIVSFKLDDDSLIKADRKFLSDKSDYFNTLLNGSFKESEENEIRLQDVDSKTLQCLLHLLQCDIGKTEVIELDLDLVTLLDVIALSDKYLLMDLCVLLTGCVEQFRISSETVPTIYQWSIASGTNLLRVETIAYSLVANIPDADRFSMFNNLFDLGYSEELISDIKKLLLRYLNRVA